MSLIAREEGEYYFLFPAGSADMIGFVKAEAGGLSSYLDSEGDEGPRLVGSALTNLDDAVAAVAEAAGYTDLSYEIETGEHGLSEQHDQELPEYNRIKSGYLARSDEDNWDDLLDQITMIATKRQTSTPADHRMAMGLLWNYFDGKGDFLKRRYESLRGVRNNSPAGLFVKIYESTSGLSGSL